MAACRTKELAPFLQAWQSRSAGNPCAVPVCFFSDTRIMPFGKTGGGARNPGLVAIGSKSTSVVSCTGHSWAKRGIQINLP